MPIKADTEGERIMELLGTGGEVQLVPMFVPVETYNLLLNLGRANGISPADVLTNAVVLYAQPKKPEPQRVLPVPDVIIRKNR